LTESGEEVDRRLNDVRERIDRACDDAGGEIGSVTLVAVSKSQPVELIAAALKAGQNILGENYAREMSTKQTDLGTAMSVDWHFLGHLQSNKAKIVVGRCRLIQSVDSARIAGKIARIAQDLGITQDLLVEVNVGGDETKTGIDYHGALDLCVYVANLPSVRLKGLMAIASKSEGDPRKSFARLRTLFEQLPESHRFVLSMGMSGDFEAAIAEGSTMVRIGSTIFGQRPAAQG
jgi:pyridoxal phosphate enzyme (YggS family)